MPQLRGEANGVDRGSAVDEIRTVVESALYLEFPRSPKTSALGPRAESQSAGSLMPARGPGEAARTCGASTSFLHAQTVVARLPEQPSR